MGKKRNQQRPKNGETPCSWVEKLNIENRSINLKLTCRFNTTLIKILAEIFCRYRQADCKIYMENQRNWNS